MSRTVFLGTTDFAATVLRRLADSTHRPQLVLAPPDRPQGRGRRTLPHPAATAARELDLPLLQVENINASEAVERIRSSLADVAAVCAFGQLIREPLLSDLEMLNVHPSLLPRWRGAAPIERAIMAGDENTGVSVMRVTEGLDSGPVALQERVPIEPDEDFGALAARLAQIGGELIVRAFDLRAEGSLELREQDDERATYAEKIEPGERRLDPLRQAAELARTVRALTPHIGAYVETPDGERLGVRAARAEDGAGEPGQFKARDGSLWLGCAEGVLRLDIVQPPAARPMPADAFLRGHQVPDRVIVQNE
ncbi:MAG: methionyl-tRNA formyltransferase [Actinomycetota bacterium]|nr:methionyl-tRNA formyltransferase [Actinomycetota bacterium]